MFPILVIPRCISHPVLHFPVRWRPTCVFPRGGSWAVYLSGRNHLLGKNLPHLYWWVSRLKIIHNNSVPSTCSFGGSNLRGSGKWSSTTAVIIRLQLDNKLKHTSGLKSSCFWYGEDGKSSIANSTNDYLIFQRIIFWNLNLFPPKNFLLTTSAAMKHLICYFPELLNRAVHLQTFSMWAHVQRFLLTHTSSQTLRACSIQSVLISVLPWQQSGKTWKRWLAMRSSPWGRVITTRNEKCTKQTVTVFLSCPRWGKYLRISLNAHQWPPSMLPSVVIVINL